MAAASITVGQLAPGSPPPGFADPSGTLDIAQPTVTSGNTYVVPGNGTITSWSHNAAAPAGQELTFEKSSGSCSGLTYTAVGHDGPRPLAGGALNTFPSSIAVKPGDVIGLSYNVRAPRQRPQSSSFPGSRTSSAMGIWEMVSPTPLRRARAIA